MRKTKIIILVTVIIAPIYPVRAWAQTDLYSFPNIEDVRIRKQKKLKPAPPFIQAVSKILQVPEEHLTEAMEKGFGRTELIRIILISQKSKKPLKDLIQEREKGTWFSKITKSAGVDNKTIRNEANVLLPAIEQEEEKIKMSVTASTVTAGVSDTLSKDTTDYHSVDGTKNHGK